MTANLSFFCLSLRAGRLLFVLFCCSPLSSSAWNSTGHRLVAAIAWHHMTPPVRSEVFRLLQSHPDYFRWIERARDSHPDRAAFVESATWPDEIRHDPRFYRPGKDEPTPLLPGFPDMDQRSAWHTVQRSLDPSLTVPAALGQPDTPLPKIVKTLASANSPTADKTYFLPWLIHLAGDYHQPMHACILRDANGRWDRNGHRFQVSNPFDLERPVVSLHAYWDNLPATIKLRGQALHKAGHTLMVKYPLTPLSLDPEIWVMESLQLARTDAYPSQDPAGLTISRSFHERSVALAERRLVEAGYRLAGILNTLLAR